MEFTLVSISILTQSAAAVLAFRLNVRHGWRWAWTMIAAALVLMTGRRILTLVRLLQDEPSMPFHVGWGWEFSESAAVTTCLTSILLLLGVAYIEPLFRAVAEAEVVLRRQYEQFENSIRRTSAEMDIARLIQRRLLPDSVPDIDGFDFAGVSLPAQSVGGDSFDFIALPDGEWGVVVTDVSGHGVGSAIQMAQLQTCLRTLASSMTDPAEILIHANRLFYRTTPPGHFATVFLGILNPETGRLRYATAGHQGWILRHDLKAPPEELRSDGMVVGILPESQYTVTEQYLDPGDAFLVMTDGVAEALSPDRVMFGVERAMDVVQQFRNGTAASVINELTAVVSLWRGDLPQNDDVTAVMVFRRQPDPSP